jgi:hypothetical protein
LRVHLEIDIDDIAFDYFVPTTSPGAIQLAAGGSVVLGGEGAHSGDAVLGWDGSLATTGAWRIAPLNAAGDPCSAFAPGNPDTTAKN